MKPFRKNVAIAIDGGGIRGVIVTKALSMLEQELNQPLHDIFRLTAGTSTGSIIAAGLASGLTAEHLNQMYLRLGREIFKKGFSTAFWFLFNHRYPQAPLKKALITYFGDKTVGDVWKGDPPADLLLTTFDTVENRTRFIKSYKSKYKNWSMVDAILASTAAPTYFPSVDGSFIDGGVGSYNNPCYLAAYEIQFILPWKFEETTLISIGTGRDPGNIKKGQVDRFLPIQYINPLLDAFIHSAADQQVDLVKKLFKKLDFRRFQVDMEVPIALDDDSQIPLLIRYGEQLGKMILSDDTDRAQRIIPDQMSSSKGLTSHRQTRKSDSLPASRSRRSPAPERAARKR
jgi:patatin-like phospholipase/acyl hydrolase